jgi:outer membrane protein insertion porin family
LNYAFRTGFIIGSQFVYSSIRTNKNKSNRFRFSAEQSGALLGFIPAFQKGDLLRFIKGDVEYVHNIDYGKTQLVMRAFAGGGIAYGGQEAGVQQTLPFYKAFWAGGPNSMRAWQVRQLGLGSSKYFDSTSFEGFDRFGDVQLEGNIEFRFPLGTVFGVKLKSAFFTDVGNIWSRKPIDTTKAAQGSDFQINRFYKEFAVGAGTGLRLDFTYFLIRLDWAYKIRDPQRLEYSDHWFYGLSLGSGQLQLGINYPF